MSALVKNLVLSPLLGLAAFLADHFIKTGLFSLPATADDWISVGIITLSVFIGGLLVSIRRYHGDDDYDEYDHDHGDEEREFGVVKWFNSKKGYGFITRDAGDDVFVHFRNIAGGRDSDIRDGQRVSFIVVEGDRGLQAEEVEPE